MNLWDEHSDLLNEDSLDRFLEEQDRRVDHGVMVRGGADDDAWVFIIRGVFPPDVRADRCASLCRVLFPLDVAPERVWAMAVGLAEAVEFVSGHGGYSSDFNAWRKETAFDHIYAWARRYYGLDVEDLNRTLPHMVDAIKGAGWLTLIGNALWDRLTLKTGGVTELDGDLAVVRRDHGLVIRAGGRPTLGDRNRRDFPGLYAKVERALWDLKVKDHPSFPGRFREEGVTTAWFRRLKEPDGW